MKKLLKSVTEYLMAILITLFLLCTISTIVGSLWLASHKVRIIPNNVSLLLSKIYSNDTFCTKIDSVTIQFTKNRSIELTGNISVKDKNTNEEILDIKNSSFIFYITKLSNFKIPYDIHIKDLQTASQKINYKGHFSSFIIKELMLNKSINFLRLNTLTIHNTLLTIGKNTYKLNHEIDFSNLPKRISIPCTNPSQRSINFSLTKNINKEDDFEIIKIINIPTNALIQLLPSAYRPEVFNDSSALLEINISKTNNPNPETKISINNISQDNIIKKINANGLYIPNSIININLLLNLKNEFGTFNGSTEISLADNLFFDKDLKVFLNIESENINLKNTDKLWPKNISSKTRNWLVSSLKKGIINKAYIKLNMQDLSDIKKDDLNAYLTFDNVTLDYFNKHKPITNISGTAHFDLEKVKIDINRGNVEQAKIENSTVTTIYSDLNLPLIIDVKSSGNIRNFLHLLNSDTKHPLEKRGLSFKKINGFSSFNSTIIIPLAKEISLDNSQISTKGQITDIDFNVADNIKIKSDILNFHIKNHTLSLIGTADINGQKSSISWLNNLIKKGHFDNQIVINSTITPDSELLNILKNKFLITSGETLGNFSYLNKDNLEKIHLQLNLEKSSFSIPDIGLKKTIHKDADFNIEIESIDNGPWKSKKSSLISKSEKINITSEIELSSDFKDIHSLVSDLTFPNSNLNISFNKNDTKEALSIRSTSLDLSNANFFDIFHIFTKEKKTLPQDTLSLSLQLDNVKMKNGIVFKNILGHFDCKKSICSNSGFSMTTNNNKNLNIKLLNKQGKNFWIIKSSNSAHFLNGLNIYKNIEGGDLVIKLHNITSNKNKVPAFSGTFKMTNFNAVKTPLLTKLIILSPFSGLIKTLESKDLLPFKTMEGYFIIQDKVIRIERAFAVGKFLTATMKGNINYKNDTLNLYGKMIPKSLINSVFNNQTEQERGNALLSTRYRIVGKITEPEVRVNPIGVLLTVLTKIPLGIL